MRNYCLRRLIPHSAFRIQLKREVVVSDGRPGATEGVLVVHLRSHDHRVVEVGVRSQGDFLRGDETVLAELLEAGVLADEAQVDFAEFAVTVLGDVDASEALRQVNFIRILILMPFIQVPCFVQRAQRLKLQSVNRRKNC